MIILFEDSNGQTPDAADAAEYWDAIQRPTFPVTVDVTAEMLDATPWDGSSLPGKCVVSPEMVLLDCYVGDEDGKAFDVIAADWAARL